MSLDLFNKKSFLHQVLKSFLSGLLSAESIEHFLNEIQVKNYNFLTNRILKRLIQNGQWRVFGLFCTRQNVQKHPKKLLFFYIQSFNLLQHKNLLRFQRNLIQMFYLLFLKIASKKKESVCKQNYFTSNITLIYSVKRMRAIQN